MEPINGVAEESRRIGSVDKALRILTFLKKRGGATVTEVADELGMTAGSVHPYLMSLVGEGFVTKRGDQYALSIRFLSLGGFVRRQNRLFRIARESIDQLARDTDATARLVVEHDGYAITMYQSTAPEIPPTATHTYEGFEESMHSTAAGKAMLAELSRERVECIIERRGLSERTPRTITDEDELAAELKRVRSQGYAVDDRECFDDIICLSDSIVTPDGTLLGAVSVSARADRVDRHAFVAETQDHLHDVTGVIEIEYVYSTWDET